MRKDTLFKTDPTQKASPIKARIQQRSPDPMLFEQYVRPLFEPHFNLGKKIYTAISEYFYVDYSRDVSNGDLSILDTIDRELRTGKKINDTDHKIKGAYIYKSLNKAIKSIQVALQTPNDYSESLGEIHAYLVALNSRLARELKSIEDPHKRREIKEKTKLDLDKLEVAVLRTPEKKAIHKFHASPEKRNADGGSPRSIKNLRKHAQWSAKDHIKEVHARRSLGKLDFDTMDGFEFDEPTAPLAQAAGLNAIHNQPPAPIIHPAPLAGPQNVGQFRSFTIKPIVNNTLKRPSIFTECDTETKRQKRTEEEAGVLGIELGH